MNRSTISHHTTKSGIEHLDVFFESEDYLETYEAPLSMYQDILQKEVITCSKKEPHRKVYLDYEGEISNGRGLLKILWTGFFLNEKSLFPSEIEIHLVKRDILEVGFTSYSDSV